MLISDLMRLLEMQRIVPGTLSYNRTHRLLGVHRLGQLQNLNGVLFLAGLELVGGR